MEERTYLLVPGGVPRYLAAWYKAGRGPQVDHLGEPMGVFSVDVGELNSLVYLWAFADHADRDGRRAALAADPAFADFRTQVRSLVLRQRNRILTAHAAAPSK